MPLRTYHKSTKYSAPAGFGVTYAQPNQILSDFTYSAPDTFEAKVTMWSLLAGFYKISKRIVATSTMAGLLIPAGLILSGAGFIFLQFQPAIVEQVKEYAGYYNQGSAALVQDNYITDRLQYVSNPGADYFQRVSDTALGQVIKPDTFSLNYKGTMYLTVPSLGFKRLPITANVQSNSKDIYNNVLANSLAHFKGTSLPASDAASNIVIYGHSAGGAYNPSPNDVLAAFTFLKDLRVGDLIIIEMDGIEYKYRMSRSKIVEPSDTTIIEGQPGKETLILLTCHPPGNNNNRLVVTAIPAN
jgi:LPXTG-site transpeptidase (sortase) family protein